MVIGEHKNMDIDLIITHIQIKIHKLQKEKKHKRAETTEETEEKVTENKCVKAERQRILRWTCNL